MSRTAIFFHRLKTWGFCENYWVWFHILAGAAGAKLIHGVLRRPFGETVAVVVGVAVAWEICEALLESPKIVYGSFTRFLYDSTGDIIGAALAACIVAA